LTGRYAAHGGRSLSFRLPTGRQAESVSGTAIRRGGRNGKHPRFAWRKE